MFYKKTPVRITGYGLAAECQIFYYKIYGFFLQCRDAPIFLVQVMKSQIIRCVFPGPALFANVSFMEV